MQMKDFETKYHLPENRFVLELRVRKTSFKTDDVDSHLTNVWDKSLFNWLLKKIDIRIWTAEKKFCSTS